MPRRDRNPLLPFHEEDRDTLVGLISRVCGCSDQTANQIYSAYPRGLGLGSATKAEFRAIGLSATQAKRLQGAFELARRVAEEEMRPKETVRSPGVAVAYLRAHLPHSRQEQFVVIYLDPRAKIIDARIVGVGTVAAVDVHPREVFGEAIRLRAHSVLVAHNHPTQDPTPSKADFELTQRLVDVGSLVGIPVVDHLVVGSEGAVSMASIGQLPPPKAV